MTIHRSSDLHPYLQSGAGTASSADGVGGDMYVVDDLEVDGLSTLGGTVETSGSPSVLTVVGPAHTGLASNVIAPDAHFDLDRTVQFATGAFTNIQPAVFIEAPTYAFVGVSTMSFAMSFAVDGAPDQGTNATVSNSFGMGIGTITGRTNSSDSVTTAIYLPEGITDGVGNVSSRGILSVSGGAVNTSLGDQTANLNAFRAMSISAINLESTTNTRTVLTSASLYIAGPPVDAGNITFTDGPYAIDVDNAACKFDVDDTHQIQIDVKTSGYTGTDGVVDLNFDAGADNARGFYVDVDLSGDHDGARAYEADVAGYDAGMTGGKIVSGFYGVVATDADDTDGVYRAFHAANATDNGGTNVITAYHVGTAYDYAFNSESGDIRLEDGKVEIVKAQFIDEFWSGVKSVWATRTTTGAVAAQGTSNGIYRLTTGAVDDNEESIDWNDICTFQNTLRPSFHCRLKMDQASDIQVRIGLTESAAVGVDDFICFRVNSDTDTNWYLVASDGGAETTDSGPAAGTSLVDFKFEFTSDTALEWFYSTDGGVTWTSQGTVAANVPTEQLQPFAEVIVRNNGGARYIELDKVEIWQDRV